MRLFPIEFIYARRVPDLFLRTRNLNKHVANIKCCDSYPVKSLHLGNEFAVGTTLEDRKAKTAAQCAAKQGHAALASLIRDAAMVKSVPDILEIWPVRVHFMFGRTSSKSLSLLMEKYTVGCPHNLHDELKTARLLCHSMARLA